jgi:hypothetical protein
LKITLGLDVFQFKKIIMELIKSGVMAVSNTYNYLKIGVFYWKKYWSCAQKRTGIKLKNPNYL